MLMESAGRFNVPSTLYEHMAVKSGILEKFVPGRRMPCILTDVRVALATSDVQSILEIPATDEIHMEDRNETMVLPELSRTMAYTTCKTVNRLARKQSHLNSGARTTKGGINLYIKLEKHKLDQIETLKCL